MGAPRVLGNLWRVLLGTGGGPCSSSRQKAAVPAWAQRPEGSVIPFEGFVTLSGLCFSVEGAPSLAGSSRGAWQGAVCGFAVLLLSLRVCLRYSPPLGWARSGAASGSSLARDSSSPCPRISPPWRQAQAAFPGARATSCWVPSDESPSPPSLSGSPSRGSQSGWPQAGSADPGANTEPVTRAPHTGSVHTSAGLRGPSLDVSHVAL